MSDCRELAEKAKGGNKEAFGALYETVYEDMYRFALYTLRNQEDAKDVVAETVADAFETIGRLRDTNAFRGWIFRILANKCKRKLKEYTKKTCAYEEYQGSVHEDLDQNLQVREVFFSLADEERYLVALQVFGGYRSKEIGTMLHKNHNTVRSKIDRALKKMEEMLQ
ncbi:MAG: RNA polymerase sigma factor [Blautia sp.]